MRVLIAAAGMRSSWRWSTLPFPSLLLPPKPASSSLHIYATSTTPSIDRDKKPHSLSAELRSSNIYKFRSLLQYGSILASVNAPAALAVTGDNNHPEDLLTLVLSWGLFAVLYFFVMPPIIFNWLRLRWYKRKFVELYFQFMFVFIFFPGIMLWAPFINFRKLPRDPTMKNPWDTPKDDVYLYRSRSR